MPSLRKRKDVADDGPVPQVIADAAPPNDDSTTAVLTNTVDEASALRHQLEAMRAAEAQARRATESQAQIEAAMSRDTASAAAVEATPQTAQVRWTDAEDRLNAAYPQLLSDPAHAQAATLAVGALTQRGMARGSPGYEANLQQTFKSMLARTSQAATLAPPVVPIAEPETPPEPRRVPVSAPVSRSVPLGDVPPSVSSKVTLSAQEREHAALCGIDELTYAKEKRRLLQLKASGFYNEQDR